MLDAKEILAKVDIVDVISRYVPVTTRGKTLKAVCPFHDDHDPSMCISRDKQIFKCFTCGTGGNAITFVQKYENISYWEALEKVAGFAGIQVEKRSYAPVIPEEHMRLYKLNQEVANFANYSLKTEDGKPGADYLSTRSISSEACDRYDLGYIADTRQLVNFLSKKGYTEIDMKRAGILNDQEKCFLEHRIGFPIKTKEGYIAGFTARKVLANDPYGKYMNTAENEIFKKSELLFHLSDALKLNRDHEVILNEGTLDVIGLERAGMNNAIAPLGTAFTEQHAKILKQLKLSACICFDGDHAGRNATVKAFHILKQAGVPYRIAILPDGMDPDDLSKQDPEKLKEVLSEKNNIYDFWLKTMPSFQSFEDKQAFIINYMKSLATENILFHDEYLHQLSQKTSLEYATLKQQFQSVVGDKPMLQERGKTQKEPVVERKQIDGKKSLLQFDIKQRLEYRRELNKKFDMPKQKDAVIAFDQDQVLNRSAILEKYIFLKGSVFDATITCLKEDNIDFKAQSLCKSAVKSFCEENKIAKANINYIAYLHKDTSYPHIHLQMWQKEPYLSQYHVTSQFQENLQKTVDQVLSTPVDLSVNPLIEQEINEAVNDVVIHM